MTWAAPKYWARAVDAGKQLLRLHRAVPGPGRRQADVAVAAVFGQPVAEVIQKRPAAAGGYLAPAQEGIELAPLDALVGFVRLRLFDELGEPHDILQPVHHPGFRGFAVAAGAPRFLVIGFHALGQVEVRDEAHVRLVDAHAEGDRGHDHDAVLAQEAGLVCRACFRGEAGVIGQRVETALREGLGRRFDPLARHGVDDARLAPAAFEKGGELRPRVGFRLYPVPDVGPVEAADETLRAVQFQPLQDVPARHGIGGRRQCQSRHPGEAFAEHVQPQVVLAEIVPPLGDAVSLVNGDQRQVQPAQELEGLVLQQPFRRQVQEIQATSRRGIHDTSLLGVGERRIEKPGTDAELTQGRHLVLHERDEGRNDQPQAGADQRGYLVAQRLAAARGHEHQRIPAGKDSGDDIFLAATETGVTVDIAQQFPGAFHHEAIMAFANTVRARQSTPMRVREAADRDSANGPAGTGQSPGATSTPLASSSFTASSE